MKQKINIRIGEGVTNAEALNVLQKVIGNGRISKNGKCYCYITTFTNGLVVSAETTKAGNDTFYIWKAA